MSIPTPMTAAAESPRCASAPVGAVFIEDGLAGTPESWIVMVADRPLAGAAITVPGLPDFAGKHYAGIDPAQPAAQQAIAHNLSLGARIVFFGVSRDVQLEMVLERNPRPDLYAGYDRADLWALLAPQVQALQGTSYPQLRQWISDAAARVMRKTMQ